MRWKVQQESWKPKDKKRIFRRRTTLSPRKPIYFLIKTKEGPAWPITKTQNKGCQKRRKAQPLPCPHRLGASYHLVFQHVSVPSRARGSGDSPAWNTDASLFPDPNSEKGCGQITLKKEVPTQKASWELKAGAPHSHMGAWMVETPPRASEYSSLLWFSCLVSRPPRNLLLWAGNLACHLSVVYWFCRQTKDLKSICTIWVVWTSGLITGNFNIVPFYMNTAKKWTAHKHWV